MPPLAATSASPLQRQRLELGAGRHAKHVEEHVLSKAIVPLVIGIVLVAAATALTIWNERRSSGAADVRALVRTELADAEAEHVDQQLEGHIVRVVGMTTAEGEVSEPALGRTVPALRLDRIAETAQWEEKQIIAQGGRDLEYSLVWSPTRIDSTRFRDAGGAHPNPPLQLAPASLLAPSPNLGAWSADAELWHAIPATQALELPEQVAVDNVGTVRRFGEWWWSGDPSKPAPGDVRLRYLVVPHGKVTLVGRVEFRPARPGRRQGGRTACPGCRG